MVGMLCEEERLDAVARSEVEGSLDTTPNRQTCECERRRMRGGDVLCGWLARRHVRGQQDDVVRHDSNRRADAFGRFDEDAQRRTRLDAGSGQRGLCVGPSDRLSEDEQSHCRRKRRR